MNSTKQRTIKWDDNIEYSPPSRSEESPTVTLDWRNISKNVIWDEILERFNVIAQRENNWDERGSKKASELALTNAKGVVDKLLDDIITAGHPWHPPFISSDEDGNTTIAWYNGEHELHLEITDDEVEYTKVWGINIDTEMDVGVASRDNYLTLWEWLLDG